MTNQQHAPPPQFFKEIVGLRAWLALWVAVGHGLQLSGITVPSGPVLKFLLNGEAAVAVFMIVSGFVITNLLMVKQEPYPRYIVRRFFRLFPAYVLACVIGFFITAEWVRIVQGVPWQDAVGWASYSRRVVELDQQTHGNFWPHFAAHAVMLHGMLSANILPHAPMTFLPAAWSISLEWQFYLVAPLVIAAIPKPARLAGVVIVALVGYLATERGLLGDFKTNAFILKAVQYFAIGIGSRWFFDSFARTPISPPVASIVAIFGCLTMLNDPLPVMIWAVVLSYMAWGTKSGWTGSVIRMLTKSAPVLLLGEASYSLYLIHRPIQVVLGGLALDAFTLTHATMFAVQVVAIMLAIPASLLIYFFVEKPGIAWGRTVANKIDAKGATLSGASA